MTLYNIGGRISSDRIPKNLISGCSFLNISSKNNGSAIYLYYPWEVEIINCVFFQNSGYCGAAIYIFIES